MEKFYIIENEGFLKHRAEHIKFENKVRENYKIISKEYNIESEKFGLNTEDLIIQPTINDMKIFENQLKKDERTFKKNSKIGKKWKNMNENLTYINRANIRDYVFWQDKCEEVDFEYEGKVYGHIRATSIIKGAPYDFIEIKGSEFYKAKEEYLQKVNN